MPEKKRESPQPVSSPDGKALFGGENEREGNLNFWDKKGKRASADHLKRSRGKKENSSRGGR